MKKLILLAGAVVAAGVFASGSAGSHKSDGTNVWIGAASGGSMKDLSNWKAVIDGVEHTDAASVSNLFMGHVSIDLRALADGAVVTNDINFGNIYNVRDTTGYTMVRDVIAGGEGGGNFTITQNGGKGMFLCQPSTINVEGGTLFWNDSASGYYPYKQLGKYGAGRLTFLKTPLFWESEAYIREGTLAFTNGISGITFKWRLYDGARIEIQKGVTSLAQVYSGNSDGRDATLQINDDATLKLSSGFNNYNGGYSYYGNITGGGVLQSTGGCVHKFLRGNTDQFSFTGLYQAHLGDLEFGSVQYPIDVNPAASLDIDGTGNLRFRRDVTAATLSGEGSDGAVMIPDGSTFTVTGPAAGATNTTFSARIAGGDFVKRGADYNLTMSGANIYKGETRVEEGTLALERRGTRPGLRAYWNFEDPDDLGADASADGLLRLARRKEPAANDVPPYQIDGVVGRAIHFGDGVNFGKGGKFIRASTKSVSGKGVLPARAGAFTFSFWMRPTSGKCGNGANFIHINSKSSASGETVEGEQGYGLNWGGGGFYFGSVNREEDNPSNLLGAFENLAFYCGVGWTRGGAWNDGGTSKNNADKVAIAKFADKNYLKDGQWHHVVGTYSNRVIRIFVDGVKMDERTRSADIGISVDPYVEFGNYSAGDPAHCYQGGLDEVQWLSGAWSEEEVMAEYLAKKPANRGPMLPEPVAHWTFDAQNADKSFADVTGHGYDLENVASNGTYFVEREAVTYDNDPSANGFAARIKTTESYLKLKTGVTLADRIKEGQSFTISMRCAYPGNGVMFVFGDGTATKSVRLGDYGTPRVQYWLMGNDTKRMMSDSGTHGNSGTIYQSAYCMNTFVYDAERKSACIYRDAKLVNIVDGQDFKIKPTMLLWGWDGGTKYSKDLRLDDMRVYGEALTGAQVAALARVVRYGTSIGDEAALAMPVVPTNSPVTVAAGAVLEAKGTEAHVVKSIAGSGTVKVRGAAAFCAGGYDGFTGRIEGLGRLLVGGGQSLPLSPEQIEADVGFADDTVVVASATRNVPLVRTSGRVVLPRDGVLRLSDATSSGSFAGKRFLVAECAEAVVPEDLSGWTFSPSGENLPTLSFKFTDGKLYAACSGGGTLLVIR